MEHPMLLRLFLVSIVVLGSTWFQFVASHQESGDWHCEADEESRINAEFNPGLVTLDGHADDWENVDGFTFSLLPALDPDHDHEYKGGKMTVKALHDGKDVYFLLQVNGEYVYKKGCLDFCLQKTSSALASGWNSNCRPNSDCFSSKDRVLDSAMHWILCMLVRVFPILDSNLHYSFPVPF